MKCKAFTLGILLLVPVSAPAYVVNGLQCTQGNGGPTPSSFVLYHRVPGSTEYVPFIEQATCLFNDVTISDNGETCFKFAAKNAAGSTIRQESTICVDPRNAPLAPPSTLGVK